MHCMACVILWFIPMAAITLEQQEDTPVVIVNPGQDQQAISRSALRAVFGMRLRNWRDNKPTRVFVLDDDHPLHEDFSKKVLNIYPHQLRLAWDRLVYSGTGQAPVEVESAQEMLEKLKNTPGAIGYLPKSMVDDSVQVLDVQ